MPISRAAFRFEMPENLEMDADQVAGPEDSFERVQDSVNAPEALEPKVERRDELEQWMEGNFRESQGISAVHLPPADAPSAGQQGDIGPTQPKNQTRRSVATGRDAPQFTSARAESDGREIDWEQAETQVRGIEGHLQTRRNAAADHLTRVHSVVERLLELTETHVFDGGQKLQSVEERLGQLEMRVNVNRA